MRRIYTNVHIALIAGLVLVAISFEAGAVQWPVAEPRPAAGASDVSATR